MTKKANTSLANSESDWGGARGASAPHSTSPKCREFDPTEPTNHQRTSRFYLGYSRSHPAHLHHDPAARQNIRRTRHKAEQFAAAERLSAMMVDEFESRARWYYEMATQLRMAAKHMKRFSAS